MGFGSYDESEQENQEFDSDLDEEASVDTEEAEHDGEIEFENGASNEELIDRLSEIKGDSGS